MAQWSGLFAHTLPSNGGAEIGTGVEKAWKQGQELPNSRFRNPRKSVTPSRRAASPLYGNGSNSSRKSVTPSRRAASLLYENGSNSSRKKQQFTSETTLYFPKHNFVLSGTQACFVPENCNFPPRILQLSTTNTTSFHHGNSNILPRNINIL